MSQMPQMNQARGFFSLILSRMSGGRVKMNCEGLRKGIEILVAL